MIGIFQFFATGEVNNAFLCHLAEDEEIANGVMVRLYEKERDYSKEKYDELIYMQVCSAKPI